MRIEELEFCDADTGWTLSPTQFFPDLTLLVGVSGVGKTRILEAIRALKRIATRGEKAGKLWGISWKIQFKASGVKYVWSGKFEARPDQGNRGPGLFDQFIEQHEAEDEDEDEVTAKPRIIEEKLVRNDMSVIERDRSGLKFMGQRTPKLSPYSSALGILSEEETIQPAADGFRQIAYLDQTKPQFGEVIIKLDELCRRYKRLPEIRESDLPTYIKLAIVDQNHPNLFQSIVAQFREVFPLVEDVDFCRVMIAPFGNIPDLRIKEAGVDKWIPERNISSGMFRTLMHLASVALWPDESLILIDEFENSLGVNCLDPVTADMMGHRHRLQFIVTSHHPYIINNVSFNHWKIITRVGHTVKAINAASAGIGRSKHQAFTQLMNNPLFYDGIAAK